MDISMKYYIVADIFVNKETYKKLFKLCYIFYY